MLPLVKKAKPPRRRSAKPQIEASPSPFAVHNPDIDPFEISGIPTGKEYQWIAISVLGEPVDDGWLANFHRTGWKTVPPKRHPNFKSDDKFLTRYGLRLYERKIPKNRPALTDANLAAIKQSKDMDMRYGMDKDPYNAGILE